jgi:sugar/nucleoside kinase (ribokinase family)
MKLGRTLRPPSSAAFDFTAVGENSLDTLAVASGWAHAGKQALSTLAELPGGQAATAAVGMARLHWRSRYAGVVGDDAAGAVVREALAEERVHAVLVARRSAATRRAVVVVDGASGERRVFEHRDPALNFQDGEPTDDVYSDTRILLVDLTDPLAALRGARLARAAGVRIMTDVDRPDPSLGALLPLVDLVVVPAEALAAISGTAEVGQGLRRLAADSRAAAVIATLGAGGAVAWCGGHEIRSPARAVAVVDTTGAGDAFRAGLAAAWLGRGAEDADLEDLLADANLVAGLNCRALGAQTALPQALEVPRHLRGQV